MPDSQTRWRRPNDFRTTQAGSGTGDEHAAIEQGEFACAPSWHIRFGRFCVATVSRRTLCGPVEGTPATGVCRLRKSTEHANGHASILVTQKTNGYGPTPGGFHLSEWRTRRGLTVAGLAMRSGLPERLIEDLEAGRDWVDQRRVLSALATSLRVDPAELTGQPYVPGGPDHSTVHALGWHARQHLARSLSENDAAEGAGRERVAALVDGLQAADDAGDLVSAALKVPGLLELAGPSHLGDADREVAALRATAHVAVSGLLRRLGYRDLAWSVLARACPPPEARPAVLAEEVRLLLDMGQAELAVAQAARAEADVLLPLAIAHATLGHKTESERLLASAREKAVGLRQRSQVASAEAFAAAEWGAYGHVLDRAVGAACLPAGGRSALLVLTASARARLGQYEAAVEDLAAAESLAPLHTRLDPLARELVSVLPSRAQRHTEVLGAMAVRFGMK
ncbi:helix-turn-helix transcriptional regulator [Streptomyces sp. NPDC006367]|uniref:helix-turn-helix domain-containing protein n=1 Tax=unclassified Streptomyces TaxID=2593676 RepID=UPI0033B85DD5